MTHFDDNQSYRQNSLIKLFFLFVRQQNAIAGHIINVVVLIAGFLRSHLLLFQLNSLRKLFKERFGLAHLIWVLTLWYVEQLDDGFCHKI